MKIIYRLLELGIKLTILFLIIAFERVVGFPVLFLTVTISMMLIARSVSRYVVFVFAAFILAIFYQQAFVFTFILLAFFYFCFVFGGRLIESNLQRFLSLLFISLLLLIFTSDISISFGIMLQLFVGIALSTIFLLKFVFVRYGFLGKNVTARQSFFK